MKIPEKNKTRVLFGGGVTKVRTMRLSLKSPETAILDSEKRL